MQIMLFQQVIVIIHTQFLLFLYLSIRNITARLSAYINDRTVLFANVSGCIYGNNQSATELPSSYSVNNATGHRILYLEANKDTDNYGNPTAGHTSSVIKPHTILALPIYIF